MKQAVLEYWQSRNPRERMILAAVAGIVLAAIVYAYAWMPIADERSALRKNLPDVKAAATQFNSHADEAEKLAGLSATRGNVNVLNAIETTAKSRNLRDKFSAVSAVDANHVRVVSASVGFDDWLSWSKDLQTQGIRIDSAQVNTLQEGSGLVKLTATFSGPGK
ncbi:MAG: type II secretion system protein GspM [Burkholderiales bacterium]